MNHPYGSGIGGGGGGILQETLKSSFLFNFRTGNVIIDTFITGFVICISTYLMGLCGQLQHINWRAQLFRWFGIKEKGRRIVISSKLGNPVSGNGVAGSNDSLLFKSILHRIKQLDCDASGIIEMSEIPIQTSSQSQSRGNNMVRQAYGYPPIFDDPAVDDMEFESKKRTNLVVSQYNRFKLTENVYGTVRVILPPQRNNANLNQMNLYRNQLSSGNEVTKEFEITIKSKVLTMNELRLLVETWVKEYLQFMEPKKGLHYFQYQPKSEKSDRINAHGYPKEQKKFAEYCFESSKRFENLFFPSKEDLIGQIDHFLTNETWYHQKGLPHTLGLLFHGEPGCGKTSTIKAIANYTKRHIVSISLAKIKSQKELFDIFYNDYINDRKVPIQKRLYVIEDIDCNKLEDVVGDRSKKKNESNEIEESKNVAPNYGLNSHSGLNINLALPNPTGQPGGVVRFGNDKPELTLADILETLDGVMEMDGRMLVITTNYPERLDPALIRPGRIDVELKFGRCSSNVLTEMYEHFCGSAQPNPDNGRNDNIWPENFNKASLLADKWTPAQVTQILVKNIRSPINGLHELQKGPKPNQF